MRVIRAFGMFAFFAFALACKPAYAVIRVCETGPGVCRPGPDGGCYLTFDTVCHYEPDNRDLYNAQNEFLNNRPRDVIGGGGGIGGGRSSSTNATPPTVSKVAQDVRAETKDCGEGVTDHPVQIATGNKILPELDFSFAIQGNPLYHMRSYDKQLQRDGMFGARWASNFERGLSFELNSTYCPISLSSLPSCGFDRSTAGKIYQLREGGYATPFTPNGSGYWISSDGGTISKISGGWIFVGKGGNVESFDDYGRPLTVLNERHIGWVYAYNTSNQLQTVTYTSGTQLSFTWSGNHVTAITLPGGVAYGYGYNGNGYLASVVYPGNTGTKTYFYEDAAQPGGLTGFAINGVRYTRYAYLADGRAAWSGLEGGVERSTFSYAATSTDVTNAIGQTTHYDVAEINGVRKILGVTRPVTGTCASGIVETFYNANGDIEHTVDGLGIKTFYSYDSDQRLIQMIEGIGPNGEADQQLITDYDWDPTYKSRLNGIRVYSGTNADYIRQTIYSYYPDGDARARLLASVSEINQSSTGLANQTLTTSYNYTVQSNGLLSTMTVDGPIAGSGDSATYTYDSAGNLIATADSLGNATTYSNYNALGQPGRVITALGAVTDYTYNARGQVLTETHTINGVGYITTTTYDTRGRPVSVQTPDSETIFTTYDDYDRVTSVYKTYPTNTGDPDISNEVVTEAQSFTYNLLSQPVSIYTTYKYQAKQYDDTGYKPRWINIGWTQLQQRTMLEYDVGGFLSKRRGEHGQVLTYTYNANGDLASVTDALNNSTTYAYDRHRRIIVVHDPAGGDTVTAYTPQGSLYHVIDPRGLRTGYAYDGLGQLWAQSSPDTGTTSFTYNGTGQRIGMTRNDGSVLSYGYDGLGRMTSYGNANETRWIKYLGCAHGDGNGKGLLPCGVASSNGTWTQFTYTAEGQLAQRRDSVAGSNDLTAYSYDGMGRLAGIHYPSGLGVGYGYAAGHLTSIVATLNGVNTTLASIGGYQVFGPPTYTSYGNNTFRTVAFDTDQRMASLVTSGPGGATLQNLSYGYDAADRVIAITDGLNAARTQQYGYDGLARLTSASVQGGNSASFGYDAVGNRISRNDSAPAAFVTYGYAGSSNQLQYTTQSGLTRYFNTNANGDIYALTGGDGIYNGFAYDGFGRISAHSRSGMNTTYTVNALDQRVAKSNPGTASRYIYAGYNQMLEEVTNGSTTDYVWNGSEPIAMVRDGQINYIHTDHLGRPEMVTTASGAVVWKADNYAFSRTVTLDSIGGLNLGLPGQYYDAESGLWHNGYRDYMADSGRYLQSDPIGLGGGLNTYAYVGGNPVSYTDPLGLEDPNYSLYSGGVIKRLPERKGGDYYFFTANFGISNISITVTKNGTIFNGGGFGINPKHPLKSFKGLGFAVGEGYMDGCPKTGDQVDNFVNGQSTTVGGLYGMGVSRTWNSSGAATNFLLGTPGFTVDSSWQGPINPKGSH